MRAPSTLLGDTRGAAQTEYVIVLCLVALGASLALAIAGTHLLSLFRFHDALLRLPVP